MEGADADVRVDQERLDRLFRGEYRLNAFACLRQGWGLFRQEPGKYIGFTLLLFLCFTVLYLPVQLITGQLHIPEAVNGSLEFLVTVLSLLCVVASFPLFAGFYVFSLRRLAGQNPGFGDFFRGFGFFLPLLLSALLRGLIIFLLQFPILLLGLYAGIQIYVNHAGGVPSQSMNDELLLIGGIMLLTAVSVFFGIIYMFTELLIINQRMNFWQAMEASRKVAMRHWFSLLWFLVVLLGVNFLGMIPMALGLLVTTPVIFCAITVPYRDIFGTSGTGW